MGRKFLIKQGFASLSRRSRGSLGNPVWRRSRHAGSSRDGWEAPRSVCLTATLALSNAPAGSAPIPRLIYLDQTPHVGCAGHAGLTSSVTALPWFI